MVTLCPDCAVGREARALVRSSDPLTNAWLAVLPFLVMVALARLIVRRIDHARWRSR